MAADTLCSYGTMAKYKDARRMVPISPTTLLGAGGEYSDYQTIQDILQQKTQDDINYDDGHSLTARETWSYLRAVLYQKRNKMQPLWNDIIFAGTDFLGFVDKIGTSYEDDLICTGFGSSLALPILRSKWRKNMTEAEGRELLIECMKVLFYRDCRALNRIQIGVVTSEKCEVSEPFEIDTKWDGGIVMKAKGGLDLDGGW